MRDFGIEGLPISLEVKGLPLMGEGEINSKRPSVKFYQKEDFMANGFEGKKKHRLNRKKYILKKRARRRKK